MNSEDENANLDCAVSTANGIARDAPEYTIEVYSQMNKRSVSPSSEGVDPPSTEDDCQLPPLRGAARPGNQNARSHGLYSRSPDRDPDAVKEALTRDTRQAMKLQNPKALYRVARAWKHLGRHEVAWALRVQARKHEDDQIRAAGGYPPPRRERVTPHVLSILSTLSAKNAARAELVRDQTVPEGSESE